MMAADWLVVAACRYERGLAVASGRGVLQRHEASAQDVENTEGTRRVVGARAHAHARTINCPNMTLAHHPLHHTCAAVVDAGGHAASCHPLPLLILQPCWWPICGLLCAPSACAVQVAEGAEPTTYNTASPDAARNYM
jgi:hypothetical protein